jgi:hypothetical protein
MDPANITTIITATATITITININITTITTTINITITTTTTTTITTPPCLLLTAIHRNPLLSNSILRKR